MTLLNLFFRDETGGGIVEYVLILSLIALAAVTAITTVGTKINTSITSVADTL